MEQGVNENCKSRLWQDKAVAFAVRTRQEMWGKHSAGIQSTMFLNGFSTGYMKQALLGWQSKAVFRSAESWGIDPLSPEEDRGKGRFAIPAGVVVPYVVDKFLRKISIITLFGDSFGKTYTLPGSCTGPTVLGTGKKAIAVVVNLADALLLHQEAGEIVDVMVPEFHENLPDGETTERLERWEKVIFVRGGADITVEKQEFFSGGPMLIFEDGIGKALKEGINIKKRFESFL